MSAQEPSQDAAARRQEIESFFTPDNRDASRPTETRMSPSGRYRLQIESYQTGPSSWNYTRGRVFRVEDGAQICDIKRNFSSFFSRFVEKEGREYLFAGRSYMSQTLIDLDRGEEYEAPGDPYDPMAFCWVGCELSPDGRTLLVAGCHWACPYEFRFYDFSDPAAGWPELALVEGEEPGYLDDDAHVFWGEDGSLRLSYGNDLYLPLDRRRSEISSEQREALGEAWSLQENWKRVEDIRLQLRREGRLIRIVDRWLSPWQRDRERKIAEREAELEAFYHTFRTRNEFFLQVEQRNQRSSLPYKHSGWRHWKNHEVTLYWQSSAEPKHRATLSWEVAGITPLSLSLRQPASESQEITLPRDLAGIERAMDAIEVHFGL